MSQAFTTEDYIRAMAPVKIVLESFQRENADWNIVEAQNRFARLVECQIADGLPSYLRNLVRQYVARVEASGHEVQDESLLSLILDFSMTKDSVIPDPLESCHVSFQIPSDTNNNKLLRLQVFPRHNDVALKLWEAGACLAEFLLENPNCVAGKHCCELGCGIGMTGLVVAGCCRAASIHLTDYTEACLTNLKHNIQVNDDWLKERISNETTPEEVITQGYLDWEEYGSESLSSTHESQSLSAQASSDSLARASVLLAADVAYDIAVIPVLSRTVYRFLSSSPKEKVAIFATTVRNKVTFTAFEYHLYELGIECDYVENGTLENLPYIFPVYNVQPRSDVRICFMRLVDTSDPRPTDLIS